MADFIRSQAVTFSDPQLAARYGDGPFVIATVTAAGVTLYGIEGMRFDPVSLQAVSVTTTVTQQENRFRLDMETSWDTYDPNGYLQASLAGVTLPIETVRPSPATTDLTLEFMNNTGWDIISLINRLDSGDVSSASTFYGWTLWVRGMNENGSAVNDTWKFTDALVETINYGGFDLAGTGKQIITVVMSFTTMEVNPDE